MCYQGGQTTTYKNQRRYNFTPESIIAPSRRSIVPPHRAIAPSHRAITRRCRAHRSSIHYQSLHRYIALRHHSIASLHRYRVIALPNSAYSNYIPRPSYFQHVDHYLAAFVFFLVCNAEMPALLHDMCIECLNIR